MDVALTQMQAALGSLLLLWSAIEREALSRITRSDGETEKKTLIGASAILRAWKVSVTGRDLDGSFLNCLANSLCDQLQGPLAVRNGVCHGLVGVSASSHSVSAGLTWETAGERHRIDWDQLQIILHFLSRVPNAMSMIASQDHDSRTGRFSDTVENREWWASEYGILLAK